MRAFGFSLGYYMFCDKIMKKMDAPPTSTLRCERAGVAHPKRQFSCEDSNLGYLIQSQGC